jgi:hypothetical protein
VVEGVDLCVTSSQISGETLIGQSQLPMAGLKMVPPGQVCCSIVQPPCTEQQIIATLV